MQYEELIKKIQAEMNSLGSKLTVDGDPGPRTRAELLKYDFSAFELILAKKPVAPIVQIGEDFGAPWVFANIDLLGRYETDPLLVARYEPEWAKEGYPSYKGLAGLPRAWCILRGNADRRKVGVSHTNSPAASTASNYGRKCPAWFGAAMPIKHKSGGRHFAEFLYWIDEKNQICAALHGNKDNQFCVAPVDISGKSDSLIGGFRWPSEMPDGVSLTKEQVLAKYPFLKVGGTMGGSTR